MAEQTVNVSLDLYTTSIGEDAGNGLLILAVDSVVGKSSRELSLEVPATTGGPPHAGSPRQI